MNINLLYALRKVDAFQHVLGLFERDNATEYGYIDKVGGICDYLNETYNAQWNEQSAIDMLRVFDVNFTKLSNEGRDTYKEIEEFICKEIVMDYKYNRNGTPIYDNNGKLAFSDKYVIKDNEHREKACNIHYISLLLYFKYGYFKPILLQRRFDIIQKNCEAIGISIPEIPRTKNYEEYVHYYFRVNDAIVAFQNKNRLSDAEMCVCLYYVAPLLIEYKQDDNLPKPTNVWLTGAGKDDFPFLDELSNKSVWACNERTRKGDIVVVYCTSPRSYIHSIWRADSEGIFNPFDHFHCRTTVCNGVHVPKVSYNDLREDSFFKEVPIVRRHLNGINGIELKPNEYIQLLRLIDDKGGDSSLCPKLMDGSLIDFGEIKLEKDVEENILIPILKELGYTSNDWSRQLSQKFGRNGKAIPDFVFFPNGRKHFVNAPFLIEAKFDMSSKTEETKAFNQALSYSRSIKCQLFGICDKERLIIYKADKQGNFDQRLPIFEQHWQVILKNGIVKSELNQLIGCEVIKTIKM